MATATVVEYGFEQVQHRTHEGIHAAGEFFDRELTEAEAWRLIDDRDRMPPVEVRPQERRDNARTALMEALTASGHESVVEISGTLGEINAQVLRRLLNGWDESLPQHELARRFAELCNELVIQRVHWAIVEGLLPSDTEVLEISDYPEALRGAQLGYRDSNKKGMVRSTGLHSLGKGQYARVIKQISRSNSSRASTFGFLRACNVEPRQDVPDDIAALQPLVYSRCDYPDGDVDIMRRLDWHAGPGVLYGDTGARTQKHPSYEELRQESLRREQEVACYVEGLAKLEEQLDDMLTRGVITSYDQMELYTEEVSRILDAICTLSPDYAEDTFGAQSVPIFEEAGWLAAHGRYSEAQVLLEANSYLKNAVTFCGVTISIKEAQEKGLNVNSFGELIDQGLSAEDRFGPLVFECKFGHVNHRKPGELLQECRVASCPKGSVGCGSSTPQKTNAPSWQESLWSKPNRKNSAAKRHERASHIGKRALAG